jgi:rfaE bifunctional protein kinase chain/domain/rfaE bifunctional protein nucleotidyltransferase chain/domain
MLKENKIKNLDELTEIIEKQRREKKVVVHCHGVFDLLHIGHIRHFEQAKQMGDILVVTITSDRYVDKGPHRPAFTETLRAEAIASLSSVDYVAINKWPTAEETLRLLRPDIYVKGSEFKNTASDITGKITWEENVVREIGAELAFTEDIVFSSTNLINRYLSKLPDEINEYLGLFRQRYNLDEIMQVLDRMSALKVLVIGDTILDEYQYCEAIGKSSKDPVLTVKYHSQDTFAGGVLAVANNVAGFAGKVQLATVLGEQNSFEDFICSHLLPNVLPYFVYQPDAPTLIKRRFVDGYSFNKLFEMYVIDDSGLPSARNDEMCEWLRQHLPYYDLVIVADYGHGAISDEMVRTICEDTCFLAVNTQANSGNRGFHTITRYPRADYVCIAEHEIRLEMRNRDGGVRPLMERLARTLDVSQFVVTRGRQGCLVLGSQNEFVSVPAFARNVVDRVGAGDSFFSVTALAAALGVSDEILGFIGNIVGSLAVEVLGNKKSIEKAEVQKYMVSLLK